MLPLKLVEEVKRLIDDGHLSQRQIAQAVGVSRGTVNAIARGRRGVYGRIEDQVQRPTSIVERCPGCGAVVTMPCILCQARAYRQREVLLRLWQSRLDTPRRVA